MMYDTHCHPYLARAKTQEEILERFFDGGGVYLNSIGCDLESSKTSIYLAQKYSGVFATIGIHPTHVLEYKEQLEETVFQLESLYYDNSKHIVGIGETGLDYYWLKKLSEDSGLCEEEIKNIQQDYFKAQIQLARRLELPLVIHNREASEDIFEILESSGFQNFVFHCFSEDLDFALKLIKFAPNCKLGFGGVVTFKNALKTQEAVKYIPLKNIIIETDSPYLTPTPHRGKQENEPLYTKYVLDKIIEFQGESAQEIQEAIFDNSVEMFLGNIS